MTVKSVVSQLKTIPAGTQISYGRTYTADKEMTVAVIPIGYADGYFRDFSSKGKMLINGVLCPVVGRALTITQPLSELSDMSLPARSHCVYRELLSKMERSRK